MEAAFGLVVFGVVIVAAVLAIATMAKRDDLYDQIGRGGIGDEREAGRPEPMSGGGFANTAERDDEIRQMLGARNARRIARGQDPLDVEAELQARVQAAEAGPSPHDDPALMAEIRELVEARNARRIRRGQEPLDVEAEIRRQVEDLGT